MYNLTIHVNINDNCNITKYNICLGVRPCDSIIVLCNFLKKSYISFNSIQKLRNIHFIFHNFKANQ